MSEPYLPPPPPRPPQSTPAYQSVPPPPAPLPPVAPKKSSRNWLTIVIIAASVAIVTGVSLLAFDKRSDDDDDADVTLPHVDRDVDRSGWALDTPSTWEAVDVPGVEAAWSVGGGTAAFGNNVTVVVEDSPMSSLEAYLNYTAELSDVALGAPTVVVSSEVVPGSDGELGRLEVTSTGDEPLHLLMYVMETKEGFVNVTYAATADTYDAQVADIEATLQTLHGG